MVALAAGSCFLLASCVALIVEPERELVLDIGASALRSPCDRTLESTSTKEGHFRSEICRVSGDWFHPGVSGVPGVCFGNFPTSSGMPALAPSV